MSPSVEIILYILGLDHLTVYTTQALNVLDTCVTTPSAPALTVPCIPVAIKRVFEHWAQSNSTQDKHFSILTSDSTKTTELSLFKVFKILLSGALTPSYQEAMSESRPSNAPLNRHRLIALMGVKKMKKMEAVLEDK